MKEEDFDDIGFLDQDKLKKAEQKIESGEITCNKDNPKNAKIVAGNLYFYCQIMSII